SRVSLYSSCGIRRDLHSFPTRRSSDLEGGAQHQPPPGGGLRAALMRRPVLRGWLLACLLPAWAAPAVAGDADTIYRCTAANGQRSEEHTSELQSRENLVCRLLLEKKKT